MCSMGFVWICVTCLNSSNQPNSEKDRVKHDHIEPSIIIERKKPEDRTSKHEDPSPNLNRANDEYLHQNGKTTNEKNERLSPSKPICKYYLRRECRHGRRGSGCDFRHPSMCFKFIQRGERPGGCKLGKECKYLHPPLCRGSKENRMVCTRQRC